MSRNNDKNMDDVAPIAQRGHGRPRQRMTEMKAQPLMRSRIPDEAFNALRRLLDSME